MLDDISMFTFAIIGAIGSLATAVAVVFLFWQSRQTQHQIQLTEQQIRLTREEMESTLRPWLGLTQAISYANRKEFEIKNHGSIPAKVIKVRCVFRKDKFSQVELRSSNPENKKIIIFPNETSTFSYPISSGFEYAGILIEYEFAKNKHGEYGNILKLNLQTNDLEVQDIFAS